MDIEDELSVKKPLKHLIARLFKRRSSLKDRVLLASCRYDLRSVYSVKHNPFFNSFIGL